MAILLIGHFTVVCLVDWPWIGSEAGGDLVLIQTSLLFICKCKLVTRDALKGHTVSKNRSISFFFFFFFLVATNLYINLFIKLTPLLLGVYCSDCLQQKQANQNPFLSLTSRGRGPTHPYLCDVNASFDLFIKNRLNLAPYC